MFPSFSESVVKFSKIIKESCANEGKCWGEPSISCQRPKFSMKLIIQKPWCAMIVSTAKYLFCWCRSQNDQNWAHARIFPTKSRYQHSENEVLLKHRRLDTFHYQLCMRVWTCSSCCCFQQRGRGKSGRYPTLILIPQTEGAKFTVIIKKTMLLGRMTTTFVTILPKSSKVPSPSILTSSKEKKKS